MRNKRAWHPNFMKYMKFIVSHPNYAGMPDVYKKDGTIRWVSTGKSEIGKKRLAWWDNKRDELSIKKEGPWISKVARAIHPTGKKTCQICGKEMSLDCIYPNKRGGMSPGAMSNAPDRLDGYHTYNLCCRAKQDTGRHKDNLSRYGEDRRAYEYWSDGDWKAASWLMKVFNRHGLSPDHIGPISLGFSHRPKFNPLTSAVNSAKNNRMSLRDVQTLITDEKAGDTVVSWHSKFIWDKLKNAVATDSDALKLSKIMRQNLHNVLIILSEISRKGFNQFLISNYLHPEFAYYSINVVGFAPETGNYEKIEKKKSDLKQYSNNAKRYIRISLESLKNYRLVKNRNAKISKSEKVKELLNTTLNRLSLRKYDEAKICLNKTLDQLAEELSTEF
jgi:hypothetical protein